MTPMQIVLAHVTHAQAMKIWELVSGYLEDLDTHGLLVVDGKVTTQEEERGPTGDPIMAPALVAMDAAHAIVAY